MSFNADADAFGIRESVLVLVDKRLNLICKKQKSKRNNNNKKHREIYKCSIDM